MDSLSLMYKVIEELARMKLPIIFKGAMVLRHVMETNDIKNPSRMTHDIDGDWVSKNVSMDILFNSIQSAVNNLKLDNLSVVRVRDYSVNKSAGFSILYEDKKLFSFDISIRENPFVITYTTHNNIKFIGASPEKMTADKIRAISEKTIFRRTKDLFDLYLLSQLDGYKIKNIIEINKYFNRELGDFMEFKNNHSELLHSYNVLKDIVNKPSFDIVYSKVQSFCLPFITKSYKQYNGTWNAQEEKWIQDFSNNSLKLSLF